MIALGCEVEEFNHFRVEKLDAAAAGWFANLILMIRAVKVDIAVVAIMAVSLIVAGLQAGEPEDARGDQIGFLLVWI